MGTRSITCPKCKKELDHFYRVDAEIYEVSPDDEVLNNVATDETLYYLCPECLTECTERPWRREA